MSVLHSGGFRARRDVPMLSVGVLLPSPRVPFILSSCHSAAPHTVGLFRMFTGASRSAASQHVETTSTCPRVFESVNVDSVSF